MFPTLVPDERLMPKDYVFALRADGREQAWPLTDFDGGRVINAAVGDLPVVLIGDAATRTVRAYESGGRGFAAGIRARPRWSPTARTGRSRRTRWSAPTAGGCRACPATSPTGSPGRVSSHGAPLAAPAEVRSVQ